MTGQAGECAKGDGYEVCRALRASPASEALPIVMITSSGDQEKVTALEVGADDFVPKRSNRAELVARVRSLLRVKQYVRRDRWARRGRWTDGLLQRPLSSREIGAELFLSVRTVERHITNVYAKIGAKGRADATAYALKNGIAT